MLYFSFLLKLKLVKLYDYIEFHTKLERYVVIIVLFCFSSKIQRMWTYYGPMCHTLERFVIGFVFVSIYNIKLEI